MRRSQQHHPVVDIVQYQLEASIHLADAVFISTEKIDRAMLDVTHQTVERQLKLARAVSDFRDPSKLNDLQAAMAGRPEQAMQCQQEIMSALVEIQAEFSKSIRDCMERCGEIAGARTHEAAAGVQSVLPEGMPSGIVSPFLGMISVWERAFREAGRLASQNVMAATHSAENAASLTREAMAAAGESVAENSQAQHGAHTHEAHEQTPRRPTRRK